MVSALVAGLAVVLLWSDDTVITPDRHRSVPSAGAGRDDAAAAALVELASALEAGDRAAALALAARNSPAAGRALDRLQANVEQLRLTDIELRYVDEAGTLSAADRRAFGDDAWVADVEVAWRLGQERRPTEMDVSVTFVQSGRDVTIADVGGGYGNAAPLWMIDRLEVRRGPRTLVMVAGDADADRFAALARQAVTDVQKVLPEWTGGLVVEVPADDRQLNRVLDAEPGTYDSIAALTSTLGGSLDARAPAHVVVNSTVFNRLGDDGAQIVMSHEATHVATDAATSAMPLWLLEGFADYVALARTDLPVEVTAGQILGEVRRKGVPPSLPRDADFDPSNKRLGTSYEAAWLACRLVAERYGEAKLLAFHDAVQRGASAQDAFDRILGTSQPEFTEAWQDYLRELAG